MGEADRQARQRRRRRNVGIRGGATRAKGRRILRHGGKNAERNRNAGNNADYATS